MGIFQTFKLLLVSCLICPGASRYFMHYRGCYRYSSKGNYPFLKTFNDPNKWNHLNTPNICYSYCHIWGYKIAGLRDGSKCYCLRSFGEYGEIGEAWCNKPCPGDENLKCGGSTAFSIFTRDKGDLSLRSDILGHLGCYKDQTRGRDLTSYRTEANSMTVQKCIDHCKPRKYSRWDMKYAGLQNGTECRCDSTYGKHGVLPISDCNVPCSGNSEETCGGSLANQIYLINYRSPGYQICNEGDVSKERCEGKNGEDTVTCSSGKFCLHRSVKSDGRYSGFCCPLK